MGPAGREAQRRRLHALSAVFVGVALVLAGRLFNLQYVEHQRFAALARDEHFQATAIPPRRGALLDTNGYPLATSVLHGSAHLAGAEVDDPEKVARALAPLVDLRPEEVRAKIDPTSKVLIPLRAGLSSAVMSELGALDLPGVYLQEEPLRVYPEGSIAAQVIGFVGQDSKGLAGLEYSFDDELAGKPGVLQSERDTVGQDIAFTHRELVEPQHGVDLVLTVDRFVQRVAERTLSEAMTANKAIGGLILVLEPNTGGILGMASQPTYSLTDELRYQPGQEGLFKTVPVTNQYEPGSVMKVITMAAALDEKLVTPETQIVDNGRFEVGSAVIKNWDEKANGTITMTRLLILSSNVGAAIVSSRLGAERFYRSLEAFGFGELTGVGLPGEVPGTMRTPADPGWTRVDLATNAFGQGIAVTPLQMLAAVSAIANNGVLMRPRIVREIRRQGQSQEVPPEAVRQVIAPATAQTLTEMMVQVLEQPALEGSRLPGYRFAGKSGTADYPTNLGYTSGKTYASIVAFGPLPNPRFSILIRIDAPEAIYGGRVAAPVLKRMAEELVAYYRLPATPTPRTR